MKIVFATNNQNKLQEVQTIVGNQIEVIGLQQAGIFIDIPEPFDTIEENSITKAQTIYKQFGFDCFSEDTGLIVPSLQGEPGVHSARYAGEKATAANNIEKLLHKLLEQQNRSAYFKTVITYIKNGEMHQFSGECHGVILNAAKGDKGFGYDPVFVPNGSELCFGEMNAEQKNIFSHRKKAMQKLLQFLTVL